MVVLSTPILVRTNYIAQFFRVSKGKKQRIALPDILIIQKVIYYILFTESVLNKKKEKKKGIMLLTVV